MRQTAVPTTRLHPRLLHQFAAGYEMTVTVTGSSQGRTRDRIRDATGFSAIRWTLQ